MLQNASNSLNVSGAVAAVICATTYLVGFALLLSVLAPLGYGTDAIDATAVLQFAIEEPMVLVLWNLTIYVLNAVALAVLVCALAVRFSYRAPGLAIISFALGIIWAALVLGAGMIANVAIEHGTAMFVDAPEIAVDHWRILHTIELGLGGGNEIAGGVWILTVSMAAIRSKALPIAANVVGIVTGFSGLMTVVQQIGELTGAIFGLSAIVWFLIIGLCLLAQPRPTKTTGATT